MMATITGEDESAVGLSVTDNTEAEHLIEMEVDGEIYHHQSEEYADNPALRTREDCERVDQARRFARWHVYRERGYDTVAPTENPDRLLAALLGISMLSDEQFEEYFGELEAQLQSHYDGSSVELPFPDVDADDPLIYQKDVYLQPDPTSFEPPVLDQFLARFNGEPDAPIVESIQDLTADEMDDLDFEIEAVSEMHVVHNDGQGTEQVDHGEHPLDRKPDARVELMAFDPASVDSFQHYLVSNLAYQIRDRFLLMGQNPPVAFRAQGWGSYEGFQCQKFCSLYEEYWSSETTVSSWQPF